MKKIIIDEQSALIKNKRNAKRDRINFCFVFVIVTLAILGKEIFDIHLDVLEQNKDKQNIVILITAIDMIIYFFIYFISALLIQKIYLHDTHLELTEYDKKAIAKYGIIHITSEEALNEIKKCGYFRSNKKWKLSILRKSTIWFYPLYGEGIEAIQDTFNRKKYFIKSKINQREPVLVHIYVNNKDIDKFKTRYGQIEHNDEAMCYLDNELHYTLIEAYQIAKDGTLIKRQKD